MDKFSELVKGFANCHSFAQTHCQDTMVTFSLRILSKVLLDKDEIDTSKANERAKLAYDVSIPANSIKIFNLLNTYFFYFNNINRQINFRLFIICV